jgi:hypothetical protein
MPQLADTLAAWGIIDPPTVIAAANGAGMPLPLACALLEVESGGGRNVFGHDRVPTGGAYAYGAPVTKVAYAAYRHAVGLGTAGKQGVGPCQLTDLSLQDRADNLGGCWIPAVNMRVGFALYVSYLARWNRADAFRAYNGGPGNRVRGSNANADQYSDRAMAAYARWVDRLGPLEEDMPLSQADADLVVNTLLGRQLTDLYPEHPAGSLTFAATVQWAAANAGRALYVANRIADILNRTPTVSDALRAELLAALHDLGPLYLVHDEVAPQETA